MKQLFLSVGLFVGGFLAVACPNEISPVNSINISNISEEEDFMELSTDWLPTIITEAIKDAYPNATLTKSYMNVKSQYKLKLKVRGVAKTAFMDKDGNWLKKTDIKTVDKK